MNTPSNLPARPLPRPTAQVQPYVDALGIEAAMSFILAFGGAELYVAKDPKGQSAYEAHLGPDKSKALAAVANRLPKRVPLAKRWMAEMMAWQGLSVAHIARTLRVQDTTVRGYLRGDYAATDARRY